MDPELYIAQLGEPRLVVCKQCRIAVWPRMLNSHFRGAEHRFSKELRDAIVHQVQSWDQLLQDSNELEMPRSVSRKFELLEWFNNGLKCMYNDEDCYYICRSADRMRRHVREKHQAARYSRRGRPSLRQQEQHQDISEPWRKVVCQRFFISGAKSSFFEVEQESAERPRTADRVVPIWDQVVSQLSQTRERIDSNTMRVVEEVGMHAANPWLERTRWTTYLAGIERNKLLQSIEIPDEETEPMLHLIWQAMDEMIRVSQHTVNTRAGIFIRMEIMRTEEHQTRYQPLQGYMRAKEAIAYAKPWKQIVMFIGRTWKQQEWKVPKYKLKHHQRKAWKDLMSVARQQIEESNSESNTEESTNEPTESIENQTRLKPIAKKCLTFCLSLLYETITHNEYDSVLVCALAVLGMKSSGWKGQDQYPPMLSAIIKVARFMIVHDNWEIVEPENKNPSESEHSSHESSQSSSTSSDQEEQQSWLGLIKKIVSRYMIRGSCSPMQWILDLRAYGMITQYNTTTEGHIDWVGEQIRYKKIQFTMSELKDMIQNSIEVATDTLFRTLMFIENDQDIPAIPWSLLRDNARNEEPNWSFVQDDRCQWPVDGNKWLQQRIGLNPAVKSQFVKPKSTVEWNRPGIEAYMQKIVDWRGLLLVLIHMTGGQPARTPEILSIHHSNTAQGLMRNVFVENGLIVIVSRYHKGYRISGSQKVIHRYLPRAVGQLYVYHHWLVRPFQETIEAIVWHQSAFSTLVWPPDPKGTPWTGQRMTSEMQNVSRRWIGVSIGIKPWRDMTINITRRFLRKDHAFRLDEDDMDGELNEDQDVIYDQQAAHGSHIAGTVYGRSIELGKDIIESIQVRFREASVQWHKFLGLNNEKAEPVLKRHREDMPDIQHAGLERRKRLRRMDIDGKLQEMLGADAEFRGCQREVIEAIMRGKNFVVMVMGTGGGKSLAFMLPAWCSRSGVSVVVVPLVALRQDMIDRCRRLKIPCAEWKGVKVDGIRLMFVTPESAVSDEFRTYMNRQRCVNQLDRIFIDECHTVLNNQPGFRPKLQQKGELNQVDVPIVMLTATLPPSLEPELWSRMSWDAARVQLFRTRTCRPNIKYHTVTTSGKKAKIEEWTQVIQQYANRYSTGKYVVYCKSVVITEDLAASLGCECYHHHAEGKDEILQRFRSDKRVIVATSAFGMGIDVSNIRIVFHIDRPRSMLEYAQESGRVGRDGLPSEAIVIMRGVTTTIDERDPEAAMMESFIQGTTCKRAILDQYLDGHQRMQCEEGETACERCENPPTIVFSKESSIVSANDTSNNEEESELIVEPLEIQSQQHERDWVNEMRVNTVRKENAVMNQVRSLFMEAQGSCSFCRWRKHTVKLHVLYRCPDPKASSFQQRYIRLKGLIRSKRLMERYSGCMDCYMPQEWCNRWVRSEGGKENVGDWRRLNGPGLCQYDEMVLSEYVVMLEEDEEFEINLHKRMQGLGFRQDSEEDEARYLGRRVLWAGLEVNRLIWELGEMIMNV